MVKIARQISIADCPDCLTRIRFHTRLMLWQKVTCPECRAALEIISLDPIELDWEYDEIDDNSDHDDFNYALERV